jgi:endo-1,4-beta-D-glucanase Y
VIDLEDAPEPKRGKMLRLINEYNMASEERAAYVNGKVEQILKPYGVSACLCGYIPNKSANNIGLGWEKFTGNLKVGYMHAALVLTTTNLTI